MNRKRRRVLLLAAATLLVIAALVVRRLDPISEGLVATYFSDARWSSSPVLSMVDSAPSTESVEEAWRGRQPAVFSTTWTGSFVVLRAGTYAFATTSDDGSAGDLGRHPVRHNGGAHKGRPPPRGRPFRP